MLETKDDPIKKFLENAHVLTDFCSQNGWIINESTQYEVLDRQPGELLIYVTFLESIMEGSGCQCDQKSCYGRLKLILNNKGEIVSACTV